MTRHRFPFRPRIPNFVVSCASGPNESAGFRLDSSGQPSNLQLATCNLMKDVDNLHP